MTEIPGWLSTEIRTGGKGIQGASAVKNCTGYLIRALVFVWIDFSPSIVRFQRVCLMEHFYNGNDLCGIDFICSVRCF